MHRHHCVPIRGKTIHRIPEASAPSRSPATRRGYMRRAALLDSLNSANAPRCRDAPLVAGFPACPLSRRSRSAVSVFGHRAAL